MLLKHKLLLCGVVAAVTCMNSTEASDYEFELAPIIVTANRDKVPEMDTPASVQVITKEKIESIGARNVYEALRLCLEFILMHLGLRAWIWVIIIPH